MLLRRYILVAVILLSSQLESSSCDEEHKRTNSPQQSQLNVDKLELESAYWLNRGQEVLRNKIDDPKNENDAKNIIFFIGDGMSIQTVTAARIYAGQDEKFDLAFDKLPTSGFAKTYCTDSQVADSSCTATAYFTGVKTSYGHVGVDMNADLASCTDHLKEEFKVEGIAKWAHDSGRNVGLVTTARVTDASPAPLYAFSSYRYLETDQDLINHGCDPSVIDDIAEQLIYNEVPRHFRVILGGGRSYMIDQSTVDEEGTTGKRGDGKNLIEEWKTIHRDMGQSEYVWNRDQLMAVDLRKVDYLLGLFEGGHMKYNYVDDPQEPSLSELVEVAVKILSRDQKGYFLFVEGARIDNAHHESRARIALDETKALSEAVEAAMRITNSSDTLIVVSADHAHTMTFGGTVQPRKADVLGLSHTLGRDNLPFTSLSYSLGEGYYNMYNDLGDERKDVSQVDHTDPLLKYYATLPLPVEPHGGDDVAIYAGGPFHHLFSGAYEQNALPYLMAYAAKMGPYKSTATSTCKVSAAFGFFLSAVILFMAQSLGRL